MNPAVRGIPAKDNNARVNTIAIPGRFQNRPLKSSILSASYSRVDRRDITPNAPMVVIKYDIT